MSILIKNLVFTILSMLLLDTISAQSAYNPAFTPSKSTLEFLYPFSASGADIAVSGTITPTGAPNTPPIRVEAGKDCIVDLTQTYTVDGTMSGSFEINYRIIVHGSCAEPPGTFDEEWIAYGTFSGKVNTISSEGKFTYIAEVRDSGNINGKMVFGQGITGELDITGNFKDGTLLYKGSVN